MEPEVLHRSDASQNDHKSKGYLPVKSDKNDFKRLGYPTFIRLFKIRLNNPRTNSPIYGVILTEALDDLNAFQQIIDCAQN